MTIDYNKRIDAIVFNHEVEELAFTLQSIAEVNRVVPPELKIKTFAHRNAHAKMIHEQIKMVSCIEQAISISDDKLKDLKGSGQQDSHGIDGLPNEYDNITAQKQSLQDIIVKLEDQVIGYVELFWETYNITHLEPLFYSSRNKWESWFNQILTDAQSQDYMRIMSKTSIGQDQAGKLCAFKSYLQQLSYKKQGLVDKLKTASQPDVKQYSMFEKQVFNQLKQTEDKLKVLEQKQFKQPIIQK